MEIIFEANHIPDNGKYTSAFVTDGFTTYLYSCNGSWARLGTDNSKQKIEPTPMRESFTNNGTNSFTLSATPATNRHFLVFVNGLLIKEVEYTHNNGNVQILTPLKATDEVTFVYSR